MLRQLIADGIIAPGDVDERSIDDVHPTDLIGYEQCHFFAGIGGWSVALRLAGWPDDRPVWTGSCPCQPFSTAGKQKGKADERHLWPVWARLIRECRPASVYGEQVASAIAHGWWDDVADDLERKGYSCGAAVLPACSVGAPHKRDRLWFVANATRIGEGGAERPSSEETRGQIAHNGLLPERAGNSGDVANAIMCIDNGAQQGIYGATKKMEGIHWSQDSPSGESSGTSSDVADTNLTSCERTWFSSRVYEKHTDNYSDVLWLSCPDGKQRPVKSGICLLAHGVQHRAPILHGFGNAIVSQVAAAFIEATDKKDR